MSRPDRKWRPSDADRERYAGAVSQAYAEGRIDATDMETRTALVYEAKTIAELDLLVEDMPAPAPAPAPPVRPGTGTGAGTGAGTGTWIRLGAGLAILAVLVGVLVLTFRDDGPTTAGSSVDEWSMVEPPEPPEPPDAPPPGVPPPGTEELPDIDMEKLDLLTLEGLEELWAAMTRAGHTDLYRVSLYGDDATVEAGAVRVDYEGGLVLPPSPNHGVMPGAVPFTWTDVPPAAVLAAIDAMPGVIGTSAVTVSHIIIDDDAEDGVTINVYPDGDNDITYAKFDATGTELLNVY